MKQNFNTRIKKGLFPEMPQSFADGLQRAAETAGGTQNRSAQTDAAKSSATGSEPKKRRFPVGKVLTGAAAAVLVAASVVIAVFAPGIGRSSHGATDPVVDPLLGRWTLTEVEQNGETVDPETIGLQMQLQFSDESVTVSTQTGGAEGQYVYRYTLEDNAVTVTAESGEIPVLPASGVYDPETNTLRFANEDGDGALVFTREPDLVGKWTLTGIGELDPATLGYQYAEWMEFFADGTVTVIRELNDDIEEKTYRYAVTEKNTITMDADGPEGMRLLIGMLTYDPETDTLHNDEMSRIFETVYGTPGDLIFSRTPDAVIPVLTTDTASDLAGMWTRTRSKYASQATDYSWIDVDMESWQSWLEITADGHAHLTEYDSESGEALHADFSVAIGSDGIQTDWESCTGMWYDATADTICMEIVGRRRDYYSRTPDAEIPEGERREITALRSQYPEYFGLDTSKGLKVYVWQMSNDSYSCTLLKGSDNKTDAEIGGMKGTTIEEMRLILSTYDIEDNDIDVEVVPFRNPLSSYWYEIDKAYTDNLIWLLIQVSENDIVDKEVCDVDGDGRLETCELSYGPTSGLFTVEFTVYRNGAIVYHNTFNMEYGYLWFVYSDYSDGKMSISHIIPQNDGTKLVKEYAITIEDGVLVLTDELRGKTVEYWGTADPQWNMAVVKTPDAVIPEVQTTDGEIAATAKRNAVGIWKSGEGDTLWITDDGTARSEALSGLTGNLTYTVEDGTLHFSLTGTDFTFTARYDESKDTLSATANGNTKLYSRVTGSIAGKWTMTGTDLLAADFSAEKTGWKMYLEIFDDGSMIVVKITDDTAERTAYRLLHVDENTFTFEEDTGAVVTSSLPPWKIVYDAATDTLRMEYDFGINPMPVFSRTPDAVIPTLTPDSAVDALQQEYKRLEKQYPEYFGLDISKGLKVYVWQMAENDFSCALISGTDERSELEIGIQCKGTTIEQMRLIYSTYDAVKNDIDVEVVPFHNPISSYWYEIDNDYKVLIRRLVKENMPFTNEELEGLKSPTFSIDDVVCDVDGDGQLETCSLNRGPTSSDITVVFTVYRNGTLAYRNTFKMDEGELTFYRSDNGLLIQHVIPWNDGIQLHTEYSISIENGMIVLTDEIRGGTVEYWGHDDPQWNMKGGA